MTTHKEGEKAELQEWEKKRERKNELQAIRARIQVMMIEESEKPLFFRSNGYQALQEVDKMLSKRLDE
jgi:hypothetical protein